MNSGMQDALNLGWKLALTVSGAAAPGLLETYDAERVPNARKVLRATLRYQRFQIPHGNVEQFVSGALFKSAMKIRPLGDALAKVTGMLDVNYEESPLSRQASEHATRETRAGWHVPDAPCRIAGEPGRLFEALRGTKANLLVFAGNDPGPLTLAALKGIEQQVAALAPYLRVHSLFASESDANGGIQHSNTITDGGQHLQSAFGTSDPEIVYVRPDGYIGLRTEDFDGGTLADYLHAIYALPETPGSLAGAV